MRELDPCAHVAEQAQALAVGQPPAVAVLIDGLPLDGLEHEVGQTILGGTTVVQLGDVGMIQGGEDLPLVAEAAQDVLGVHAALEDLDGHLTLEVGVVAVRQVHGAHTSLAEAPVDLVVAEHLPLPGHGIALPGEHVRGLGADGILEEAPGALQAGEQLLDALDEVGLVGVALFQKRNASLGIELEGLLKQLLDPWPALIPHEDCLPWPDRRATPWRAGSPATPSTG